MSKRPGTAKIAAATGLPLYSRRASSLRWLNSAVLDVDIYKIRPDLGRTAALELVLAEITNVDVPPSLICSSGRGVWALWMLQDHKNRNTPVPAFPDTREIYQRVNQALVKRFDRLGADSQCTDPSRVMRVPGSVHSGAPPESCIVEFFRLGDNGYTLPELANVLGVATRKVRLPGERTKSKNLAKVNAGLMRWRIPLEGFHQLWKIRGQFAQGVRHSALYIYAGLLRRNHVPETEITRECSRLAESCSPVLTATDVARCVLSSWKLATRDFGRSIRNETIARMLKITDDEKVQLPEWFRPERRKKADQIAERRRLIARELRLAGKPLCSSRDMAKLLVEKYGIEVTYATVQKDFLFLKTQERGVVGRADFTTGKFPVLIDSKSSLVLAEKTYQHLNPSSIWKSPEGYQGEPNNFCTIRGN